MSEFFASGRIIDWIVCLVAAEILILLVYRLKNGNGIPLPKLLPNLISGLSLIIGIRLALNDAWWGWLALSLTIALLAHLFDLKTRWQS